MQRTGEDIDALLKEYGYQYNPLGEGDTDRFEAWANKLDDDEVVLNLGYEDELLMMPRRKLIALIRRQMRENEQYEEVARS